VLCDDDLSPSHIVRIVRKSLIVVSVDEDHHIGILLDRSRLTKVAELRTAVAALTVLRLTRKLRERDDRDIHFLCGSLQRSRDSRNLLLTHTPELGRSLHQLQVVDHDETHPFLLDELLHLRTELHHRKRRCVIDIDRGLGKVLELYVELLPFPVLKLDSSLDLVGAELCLGHHHTVRELLCRHFKREDRYRHVEIDSRISGDVDNECSLSDRRTCRQNDQVRSLPSEGDLVKRRESRRYSAESFRALTLLEVFQGIVYDLSDLLDILLDIVLDGREKLGLRRIDKVVDIHRLVIRSLEDIV